MLTQEQIAEMRKKIGIPEGGLAPTGVSSTDRIAQLRSKATAVQTQGNQFDAPKDKSFFEKARDFTTDVIGGGKLAEGLGKAIAAPGLQRTLTETEQRLSDTDLKLIKLINEKKAKGEDTARLENARSLLLEDMKKTRDVQTDFVESLPSNEQVIGSAMRLGATVALPTLTKGIGSTMAPATTVLGGIGKGALIGGATGAIEGTVQGAGIGMEQDKDIEGVAQSALKGGVTGAVGGAVIGGVVGGVTGKMRSNEAFKKETERLLTTNPDARVAQYKLNGQGQVSKDPVAQEAIKQGFDEGVVATVKGSTPGDKAKMAKMVDILEGAKRDPKYGAVNRPSDVIGDSVLERFKVVNTANQTAEKQLDTVAKSLEGQKANPVPAVQSFIDDLDNLGVKFKDGKAVYKGSQIEGLKEPQAIIDRIVKRMNEVSDDGYELHKLKKFIDEQVTYGKTGGGLTGKTESILKGLRYNIDEILDTSFPEYNQVNTTYTTTRNAIDDFMSAAGSKFNPNDANANARVGTLARRILSNAQSRTQVLNTLQKLQDVAEINGGKFSDDIIAQTVFVNDLERIFGTSAPTSLAGETAKGFEKAGTMAQKLKTSGGIFDLAMKATGEGIEKARGINQEGMITAIRELLK